MQEFVNHYVVAVGRRFSRLSNVVPVEHHRPEVHRFAGNDFLPFMNDPAVVGNVAWGQHFLGLGTCRPVDRAGASKE